MKEKLTNPWFKAHFITKAKADGSFRIHHPDGSAIGFAEAQGMGFRCPCGYGALDKHGVLVVFANPPGGILAPPNFGPVGKDKITHPRWTIVSGTTLDDLTLSPSIAIGDPECWHGYLTGGILA